VTCRAAVRLAACAATLVAGASPAAAYETAWVPARWTVVGVGAHERSLELGVSSAAPGSCGGHELRVTVRETPTNVGINVLEAEARVPPGVRLACPAIAYVGFPPPRVALAAPLAGRRIYALPTQTSPNLPGESVQKAHGRSALPGVPRLIGFAPADAKRALEAAGLCERIHVTHARHGLPRVIAQTPSPGTRIPYVVSPHHSTPRCGLVVVELAT